MHVRDAVLGDLPGILEIHNEAIAHSTAIWDETLADLDERRRWFDDRHAQGFPILVADIDGRVAGYASYGVWRAKSGYRHTVENSVYVHADFHRRGVATALMTALIDRARVAGVHVIVASIESTNTTSIALHERFGFRLVAQMPEVGRKFGRWMDMSFLQLTLPDPYAS
ncbi:GNAT family N-acetyltransferase [Rhodococcus sp. SGAir0479]|uniref:GNAT family N-acetyltransferase n=1 Tax=Rhodococcus sp. SGAir0479 TaxID=2567884 RepID=UPI0010CCC3E3|nr:GNAT family N-acetyltransferase [Rhodococcus sp. SGAir0479]QCQ90137.1 N-acetyltransferase family protein [Rhodococcus sp. SGAir0479]